MPGIMMLPEKQPSFWESFGQSALGTMGGNYLQSLQGNKEQGAIQNAFQGMDESSSPLEIVQKIATLPVGEDKKKMLLEGFKAMKKQQSPFDKPISPYQNELIKQKQQQLDLQKERIEAAKIKRKDQLPKMISDYTKNFSKDANLDADDKVMLDSYVREAYEQGSDLDQALQEGLETLEMRNQMLEQMEVPSEPFMSWMRPEAKIEAMEEAADTLREVLGMGIKRQKDLKNLLKKGGWSELDQTEILRRVGITGPQKRKTEAKKAEKTKLTSDEQKKEVARSLLREAGGDKTKAMKLFEERYE